MKTISRREFGEVAAITFAAAAVPARAQTTTAPSKPVGYAAIGLGVISEIFMRGCQGSNTAKITALVTGHPQEKGEKFAAMYGIPKTSIYTYETFDRIRDNKDVDAVYVGLPNGMHREFTVRAAAAGKHVLCEKPMANTSAECREMIEACRKANVKLMIAYRIQYEPLWAEAIRMIKAGDIGEIESFQGGFFNQQKTGAWRLNRKLAGGGPIFDLGVYPLNASRYITGEEPANFAGVMATREAGERFAEVEQSMEWTMKFPSGIIASFSCSYGARAPGSFRINGANGALIVEPAFNYDGLRLRGSAAGKPVDIASTNKHPYMFTLQAEHFAACVRENRQPHSTGEEGLKDLMAIEAIYKAVGKPVA
ncbi:MAG: Gfo/Idh/MocA family oxidoreductase [Vicinamibacteria bacterium]